MPSNDFKACSCASAACFRMSFAVCVACSGATCPGAGIGGGDSGFVDRPAALSVRIGPSQARTTCERPKAASSTGAGANPHPITIAGMVPSSGTANVGGASGACSSHNAGDGAGMGAWAGVASLRETLVAVPGRLAVPRWLADPGRLVETNGVGTMSTSASWSAAIKAEERGESACMLASNSTTCMLLGSCMLLDSSASWRTSILDCSAGGCGDIAAIEVSGCTSSASEGGEGGGGEGGGEDLFCSIALSSNALSVGGGGIASTAVRDRTPPSIATSEGDSITICVRDRTPLPSATSIGSAGRDCTPPPSALSDGASIAN